MSDAYKAAYWSPRIHEKPETTEAAAAVLAFVNYPTVFCVGVKRNAKGRTDPDSPIVLVHSEHDGGTAPAPSTEVQLLQHLARNRVFEARYGTASAPPKVDDLDIIAFRPTFPAEETEWVDRTTGRKWMITAVNYRPDLGDRLPTARMVAADDGTLWDCDLGKFCTKFTAAT